MTTLPKYTSSRSNWFAFAIVILVSVIIAVFLILQVDAWSRAAFNQVKNNSQQMRSVLIMRDALQKRELTLQRMLNTKAVPERDTVSEAINHQAGVYARAREQLKQAAVDKTLPADLTKLDERVASAAVYQNNLLKALAYENMASTELEAIILKGRKASVEILNLLDQIVDRQSATYENVITEYEQSRQYTLLVIGIVFSLIAFVFVFALRLSNKQFKRISRLSILDDVSGTYNRRYFEMVLEEEWMRSMREYTPLSLLMVDIDYFKAYNDSFGHHKGDICLGTTGKILSSQLKRATDSASRYGGDEFAIVLPNTSTEHARLLAERLRRSVEDARIKAANDEISPWVTVSIGVATTTAEFEQSSSILVKAADACLYESKRKGRNRVSEIMIDELD